MNVNKRNLLLDYLVLSINTIVLLALILLLTGCSQKEVIIQREEVKKQPLNLNNPKELKLNDITYTVLTDKNSKEVFDKMKKDSKEPVLISIETKEYENLSLNLSYIRKYIIEQQQIINAYKNYYEPKQEELKPKKLELNIEN